MARAGRKRKLVPREADGRPSRAEAERGLSPAVVKRIVERASVGAVDARLGSAVGRLLLVGSLNARQAGAAWRFAEIAAEYVAVIGAPVCKPAALERGAKGAPPDDESEAGQALIEHERRAVRRYERASAVLDAWSIGREVKALALDDRALSGHAALVDARLALDALASHFAG